ncbi:ABC transporter substrate-binding protein [Acidaminobacter sp. JC074]|uniref:ABC transporter substrate-binding protein n=1 Tax=Acidaminobacter sp. JC074 TaxID=2530199 RepID=UPI001F102ACE|nr:ABC transporter substrate-binding protein [Acidaminobacter sp. JC074]MCH4888349.1 ABC transporter substrate-binding protein [Acidaminobacter sp. JC074]
MKRILILLTLLALMTLLIACSGDIERALENNITSETELVVESTEELIEDEPEINMRPFVVGCTDFNGDFYKGWTNSSYDNDIISLVWGFGLMTDNSRGELISSPLVENLDVTDDLFEWTFTIVPGVSFHNGEALTVSDVKFTYEFYMNTEALNEAGASSLLGEYIESIEIDEDKNTITFRLKKVMFTMDYSIFYEVWILPEDTILEGAKATGQTSQQWVKSNISSPIGYGPYIFVEYKESEFVRLRVNPDYIDRPPAIQEIIVKVVPVETAFDQLVLGKVDLLDRSSYLKDEDNKDGRLTQNIYYRHGGGTMILHSDFEAFQLTEVRQAFAYVLNRTKIIELFLENQGLASQGPYSKNHWMMYDDDEMDMLGTDGVGRFESSLINYDILDAKGEFDESANIEKAHELLDLAVSKTHGQYIHLTKVDDTYKWKGEDLEIKVIYTSFWSDIYNLVWNENYISKLGFKVTLYGLDWPAMYSHWTGDTEDERQYHAFVGGMGYGVKSNPRESYSVMNIKEWGHPSDNSSRFTGGSSYTKEEWEELLIAIENCHPIDGLEAYKALWREFVVVINNEVPIIPVYSNRYSDVYDSNLENFETNALWSWTRAILDANWK